MQRIFPPYYQTSTSGGADEMTIVNTTLSAAVGFTVASFPTDLQYYDYWSNLPVNSTVYSVISGTTGSTSSPSGIPVIVENRIGTGKYLWTAYHNQDIKNDPQLIKIVQYFLLSL
jgi:type 1 glutamine amidotransferase